MSESKLLFENSINDAKDLLKLFDETNKSSNSKGEVLKRAGLVMALTSWETYVEDRITEAMNTRLSAVSGSYVGNFISNKLKEELKRFNNPNSEKTRKIFKDYLDVDITEGWSWSNIDSNSAKKSLDEFISKRGDAVHRAKTTNNQSSSKHLIKRDELEKVIRFIESLVNATDLYLEKKQ